MLIIVGIIFVSLINMVSEYLNKGNFKTSLVRKSGSTNHKEVIMVTADSM